MYSFFIFLFFSTNLYGGIGSKVGEWFDQNNYSNRTSPTIYKAQSAQYYSAGSYSERNEIVDSFRFVDVQSPKLSAGCGGIDLYMGGLSTVNADKFLRLLRSIGQNSKTLAFMLALKTVTPMIENTMNEIQHFANKYLNMNLDSCKAAQALVGGAMEYMGKKQANCIVKKIEASGVSWQKAEDLCGLGGEMRAIEGNEPNKIGFVKGNLAWYVLMEDPYFQNDLEFAELIMNITGTLVVSGNEQSTFREIPSAIRERFSSDRFNNIYNSLLKGNKVLSYEELYLYTCVDRSNNPNSCINISNTPKKMSNNFEGLESSVRNIFKDISRKIYSDEPLNSLEIGLINSTDIPVYKLLVTAAGALPNSVSSYTIGNDYSRLIAEDLLLKSLHSIITKVEFLSSNAKNIRDSKELVKYQKDLRSVLNGLEKKKMAIKTTVKQRLELQTRIQLYEKMIIGKLNHNLISNLSWSSE